MMRSRRLSAAKHLMDGRMFQLTLEGLDGAMRELMR